MDEKDEQASERARIGARIARGIAWNTIGNILGNLARILVLIVLGRLLAAEDFGLVAKANTVLVFVKVVGDLGLGGALVQHKAPTQAHITTAFTVSLLLGGSLALAVIVTAPWIASAYRSPELAPLLQVIASLVVLRSVSSVALQLCRREMDFATITRAELVGYVLGAGTAIASAVGGAGAWSLVYGYFVESLIATTVIVWRHPPKALGVNQVALRDLLRYGTGETITQVANLVATQGDYAIVGRELGDAELGLYSRAYELVRFPANVFNSIVGSVLFPGMSRLQEDPKGLGDAFRRVLFATSLVLMPASALLIVHGSEVMEVLLGPSWEGAVLPFQIMAVGMLVRTNYKVGAIVARSRGDTYGVALTQLGYAAAVVGGGLVSVRWGIEGVAVTTTASMFLVFLLLTWLGMRHARVSVRSLLTCHAWAIVATVVVATTTWLVAALTRPAFSPAVVLLSGTGVALVGVTLVFSLGLRSRDPDWIWIAQVARSAWAKLRRQRVD